MSSDTTPAATGKIVVLTAPSGSGKTTLVQHLIAVVPSLRFSISACTRPIREDEVDGLDYHFLSTEEFRRKIDQDAFLEWEEVYPGRFYGTLKSELDRIWGAGGAAIFDLDVAGAAHIRELYTEQSCIIFIRPPSLEVLQQRLRDRQTESKATLQTRIDKASFELQFENQFDYVVINDDLATAKAEVVGIVQGFLI